MTKKSQKLRAAGQRREAAILNNIEAKLGSAFVRLTAADRREVLLIFEWLVQPNTGVSSVWDRWSSGDMRVCQVQLRAISRELAESWRRWASELCKKGDNDGWSIKSLVSYLIMRTWTEERQNSREGVHDATSHRAR